MPVATKPITKLRLAALVGLEHRAIDRAGDHGVGHGRRDHQQWDGEQHAARDPHGDRVGHVGRLAALLRRPDQGGKPAQQRGEHQGQRQDGDGGEGQPPQEDRRRPAHDQAEARGQGLADR
jgi:hypothetical protein